MEVVPLEDGQTGEPIEGVTLTLLAGGEQLNAQRFEIEPGAEVPVHSHDNEQVGRVAAGTLRFVGADGTEREVKAGDSFAIAAGEPHGARNDGTATVSGVEMFAPPREAPDWRA